MISKRFAQIFIPLLPQLQWLFLLNEVLYVTMAMTDPMEFDQPFGNSIYGRSSDRCYQYSRSSCWCNSQKGCRYNQRRGACMERDQICGELNKMDTACARNGYYYALSGSPCKWEKASEGCTIIRTVLAANLNGKHYTGKETGIVYEDGGKVPFVDPYGTKERAEIPLSAATGELQQFHSLFGTYLTSTKKVSQEASMQGVCLSYVLKGLNTGYYEAILHFAEPTARIDDTFDVKLNDVIVLKSFNIYRFGGHLKPLSVVIRFHVVKTGAGKTLKIMGHPDTVINEGFTDLSFCFGCCKTQNAYLVSGFAVVQIKPNLQAIGPVKPHRCHQLRNQCECRENGCEFDPAAGSCTRFGEKCAKLGYFFEEDECVRPSAFYAYGGNICGPFPPSDHTAECQTSIAPGGAGDLPFYPKAINLAGAEMIDDVTGIVYAAGINTDNFIVDGSADLKIFQRNDPLIESMSGANTPMFQTYIESERGSNAKGKQCLKFFFKIQAVGHYELTLKLPELAYPMKNKRSYSVYLAGVPVLAEINLSRHLAYLTAAEFIVLFNFKEDDNHIYIKGFVPKYVKDRDKVPVSFCASDCDVFDPNFVVSAFSLQQLTTGYIR